MEFYFVDDKTVAFGFISNNYNYGPPAEPDIDAKDDKEPTDDKKAKVVKESQDELLIKNSRLAKMLAAPRDAKGRLSDALILANSGKPIVGALNQDVIPGQVVRLLPPEYQALFRFKLAVASIDFEQEGHVDIRLTYNSVGEAASAELSAKEGINLARSFLEKERAGMEREVFGDGQPGLLDDLPKAAASLVVLGYLNKADDFLVKLPIKQAGNALTLSLKMPQGTKTFLSSGAASAAIGWLMSARDFAAAPSPQFDIKPPPPPPPPEKEKEKK